MAYRAREHDLCDVSTSPWNNHWELRASDRIEKILADEGFFLSIRHLLKAGDLINITAFIGSSERVKDIAEVRIVQVHDDSVDFIMIGDIITIPEDGEEEDAAEPLELSIKKGHRGAFLVQDQAGNTLDQFKSEQAAQDYMAAAGAG